MGREDVSDGGKCFQDRKAGVTLLCLKNSKEVYVVGTLWERGKEDDVWPLDFILSEKGHHGRVLRTAVMGSALPLEGGAVCLLVENGNKASKVM